MSASCMIQSHPEKNRKLPDGWRLVRLKEMGVFEAGGTPAKELDNYWNGTIPFVTGADITDLFIEKANARAFLTKDGLNSGKTAICKAGTVLIVTRTRVGRAGIAQETMGVSQDITAFKCGPEIHQEFLCRFLHNISEHLIANCRGATIQGLTREFIDNLEIPLPPLAEQQEIVAVLCEQMAAIEKARLAAQARLSAVKALPAAYLRQVFPKPGQPLPSGWRWVKLGEVCSTVSKGTTPTTLGFLYTSDGIPFLRAEDINGKVVDHSQVTFHISPETDEALYRSRLLPGDFLITIAGTLGRVGYLAQDAPLMNCNQAVAFARPQREQADVEYLVHTCQHHDVISPLLDLKAGGALQNLNLQQIRGLEIPLPPLQEQQRVAKVLREQMVAVDKARMAAEEELNSIKTLPAALLRRAFNGEI